MSKQNKKIILVIVISMLICWAEVSLLINLFPNTGLARIVFVPFNVIMMLFFSWFIAYKTNTKSIQMQLFILVIFHILMLHFYLWSWPQDYNRDNLIYSFYSKVF